MPKGKPCSAEFKARVVLEALRGAKTVNELAAGHRGRRVASRIRRAHYGVRPSSTGPA